MLSGLTVGLRWSSGCPPTRPGLALAGLDEGCRDNTAKIKASARSVGWGRPAFGIARIVLILENRSYMEDWVGPPKSKVALERLGLDVRGARLRRGIAVVDLAARAGTVARLEKGDPGVGIGTLADILVALGLIERLADLVDIRKDDLGLALASEQLPRRGKTYAAKLRKQKALDDEASVGAKDVVDPDGAAF